MSEKDLNIEYICEKTLLNKDDELVPIILSLIQESYKAGLCQTEFDNTMNLIEENQELKKHLKVPKTCNLKTLEDYKSYYEDTTREQILEDTYIEYCAYVNLAHRYSELKKQIENCYCNRTDCSGRIKDSKVYDSLVQKVETQQKEFINYLEDEISKQKNDIFANALTSEDIDLYIMEIKLQELEEILQKYKETIQTKNNNSV